MIEVEMRFQPTEEQLGSLIKDSLFVGSVEIHDIYYDYPDFRLLKKGIRLRNRDGFFELKIKKDTSIHQEIEDKHEIEKYFNLDAPLGEFINKDLLVIIDYKNKREKYKKGEFNIDIDKLSFGYNMCELELLVEKEEQASEAREKIINLAKEYNFEIKKILPKTVEYLRLFNKEKYEEIFSK